VSGATSIEWTDATWNPVRGCSRVSEGCRNCYAERQAARFRGDGDPFHGFAYSDKAGPHWTGRVELIPSKLEEPLRWKKPRRIFVNSMSDLFHEKLSDEAIAAVFGVMAACPQHTFQVLTKRPKRMRMWFEWVTRELRSDPAMLLDDAISALGLSLGAMAAFYQRSRGALWPLPNVWLGMSVEDQATADERIPLLLQTPAALRFVSYEPALGTVDFRGLIQRRCMLGHPFPFQCRQPDHDTRMIDWLIVGGESGPGARPFDLAWARSAIAQCRAAGVPVFVKQLGARPVDPENDDPKCSVSGCGLPECEDFGCQYGIRGMVRSRKGSRPSEWPEDLRVREFPSPMRRAA